MKTPGKTVVILLALQGVARGETAWKAGVATADITPTESIWLAGYGDRTRPSEGVLHNINVKALALDAEAGKPVVLLTADLVGIPREISDPVASRCEKEFNLARDRLILNASHTHSAPVMARSASPRELTEPQWQAVDRYQAFLNWQDGRRDRSGIKEYGPGKRKLRSEFRRHRCEPATRLSEQPQPYHTGRSGRSSDVSDRRRREITRHRRGLCLSCHRAEHLSGKR